MFLYIDETGNTGARFLDANQPLFISAAMATKIDFDAAHCAAWDKMLGTHNLDALHASKIGMATLEKLSLELVRILMASNARFCVSRVEKIFALATNVHQVLFDPAENAISDWMFVNDPGVRLATAVEIARHMRTSEIGNAFESCLFHLSKEDQMQKAFVTGCLALAKACETPHSRPLQLAIARTARWAGENPGAFTLRVTGEVGNGRHPNVICFNNLSHCAQKIYAEWKPDACTIKHDRQNQYGPAIKYWQELWSNAASGEHILPSGEVRQYQALPQAQLCFEESNHSPGLQIVDACLWIINRNFQRKPLSDGARKLLQFVVSRAELSDYSIEGAEGKLAL